MSDKTLKFTLRDLFAGSLILLGLIMWSASLALPAVALGSQSAATGFECLTASLMLTFGFGTPMGGWSTLVTCLHLVLLGSVVLQLTHPWPRSRWRRWSGTLLIAGALTLEMGLSQEFEATYRGFHLWCMSFLMVGAGLWVQALAKGPAQATVVS